MIGLGLTNQNPDVGPTQLMEADLKNEWHVSPGYQVSYSAPRTSSPCNGDLGGPIVSRNRQNKALCIPQQCHDVSNKALFVSNESFTKWLMARLTLR